MVLGLQHHTYPIHNSHAPCTHTQCRIPRQTARTLDKEQMAAVASAGAVCPEPLMTLRSLSLFLSRPFWPVAPLPSAASPTVRERERERESSDGC